MQLLLILFYAGAPLDISFLKHILESMESKEEQLQFFCTLADKAVIEVEDDMLLFGDSFRESSAQYFTHVVTSKMFSWKHIAEALYIRGKELFLENLFCLIKSPEGTQ